GPPTARPRTVPGRGRSRAGAPRLGLTAPSAPRGPPAPAENAGGGGDCPGRCGAGRAPAPDRTIGARGRRAWAVPFNEGAIMGAILPGPASRKLSGKVFSPQNTPDLMGA